MIEQPIAMGEPEGRNPGTVDPLPQEFGGCIQAGYSAEKPVRLVTRQLQNLRHLGVVTERIKIPGHRDVHAQLIPIVTLAVKDLAHERLSTRHVHVRHDVGAAYQLEPSLFHEFPESCRVFRVPLEIRPDIRNLVKHKTVFGVFSQQVQRRGNVDETHFEVLFAGLENGAFPVRVRDDPEHVPWGSSFLPGARSRLSENKARPRPRANDDARNDKPEESEKWMAGHRASLYHAQRALCTNNQRQPM